MTVNGRVVHVKDKLLCNRQGMSSITIGSSFKVPTPSPGGTQSGRVLRPSKAKPARLYAASCWFLLLGKEFRDSLRLVLISFSKFD